MGLFCGHLVWYSRTIRGGSTGYSSIDSLEESTLG